MLHSHWPCYRVNVCDPKIHMLKSDHQCDGIWAGAFGKRLGQVGKAIMNGLVL